MPAKQSFYRRCNPTEQVRKLLVFSLFSASAVAGEPSFYAQFTVDALGTGRRTDFFQSGVVPMRNIGYLNHRAAAAGTFHSLHFLWQLSAGSAGVSAYPLFDGISAAFSGERKRDLPVVFWR